MFGWPPGRMTACARARGRRTVEQCHADEVDAQTNGTDDQNQAGRLHGCRHNNRTTTQESQRELDEPSALRPLARAYARAWQGV